MYIFILQFLKLVNVVKSIIYGTNIRYEVVVVLVEFSQTIRRTVMQDISPFHSSTSVFAQIIDGESHMDSHRAAKV